MVHKMCTLSDRVTEVDLVTERTCLEVQGRG